MYDGDFEKRPREFADLVMGIPAVICFVAIVPFLLYIWSRESKLEDVYRSDARQAFTDGDHELSVVCFDRLVRLDPRQEDRYHLGLSLVQAGDNQRGASIMAGLAPDEEQGYGLAHVWRAKQILQAENLDQNSLLQATSHLVNAKKTLYKDGEIDFLLASCYWMTGSQVRALESLRDASLLDPVYYYDLHKTCLELKLLPAATKAAGLSSEYLRDFVAKHPLDRTARHQYVEVLVWLKAFDDAEQVLMQGAEMDPEGKWNKTLAKAYLARFIQSKSENVSLDELLTYLEKAMAIDPENPEVLKQLADVGIVDPSGRIEKMLEETLTTGRHNAIVHFVLGSRLWQLNLVDDAVFHMKRAYELDNRLGFAANNLAYHELLKEDGDLESGLTLINEVLKKFPNSHAFRETRGQLLTRLQRWEDALNDLEYALAEYPKEKALHTSIAKCYDAIGQKSLAERHQEIARDL